MIGKDIGDSGDIQHRTSPQDDDRDGALASARIGDADYGDFGDADMGNQQILNIPTMAQADTELNICARFGMGCDLT